MKEIRAFVNALMARRVAVRYAYMTHRSPEALQEYLHEHPDADPKKHVVRKEEKVEEKENGKAETAPKALKIPKVFSDDELKLGDEAHQEAKDPDKIFEKAEEAHQQQLKWLNQGEGLDKAIGATVIRADKDEKIDLDKPGPIVLIGPMKKQDRSTKKVETEFEGDWSRLTDVVRASVAVDSIDQIEKVVSELRKSGLKIAKKPKDRFTNPTDAGYRDISMNVVYPNGHIGELQLHLKSILKAKEKGHVYYEGARELMAKLEKGGRKALTEDQLKVVDDANAKMKDLYDKALAEGTKETPSKNARTVVATQTRYYDYDGQPAYWTRKEVPMLALPKGDKAMYDLETFFRVAMPISKSEFESMKKKQKTRSV